MATFPAATLFLLFISTFSQLHFTTSKLSGLTLQLIPRDSPESPLYPGNLTQHERLQRLIRFSDARVAYLEAIFARNAKFAPDESIIISEYRDDFYYIVYLGIGTAPEYMFLLLDTGGGLIWSQCQPCKNCYRQSMPIYDPLGSSSYRKLSCDHPLCVGDNNFFKCVDQKCVYDVSYGGGARTKGVASWESFTIGAGNRVYLVQNMLFGCSDDTHNPNFERTQLSGIMGFSLSPDSLPSQLMDQIGGRFSYCFPPFLEDGNFPRYVKFGDEIPQLPGNIQSTNFQRPPPGYFYYYLKLIDISVGSLRLDFEPGLFDIRPDGSGGIFIDSGTLMSSIDQFTIGRNAYADVMGAFQNYYDGLRLQRMGQVGEGFDLCYKNPPLDFPGFTTLTYHFEGASYFVEWKYLHFFNIKQGYFCVFLKPANGFSILGSWFQQNKRIIYDLNHFSLQFYDENCKDDPAP
ncbi:aspartic proteinase nepenthesin-1-like [Mangifera indica]|uniref:aspartic proteinase nepenthesin-1-like n=1 Tax=Mangifera indica TaxID=29780 RepID=UPI001CFAD14E|nr:aspartic proteinase nepenthesin-1-like [Mangifera indica]